MLLLRTFYAFTMLYLRKFIKIFSAYFVITKIITNFASEFIPHLRKGNRRTQASKLCVFCFYRRFGNRRRLYFCLILSRLLSFPVNGYAVNK